MSNCRIMAIVWIIAIISFSIAATLASYPALAGTGP
jgi:hypothetical protein